MERSVKLSAFSLVMVMLLAGIAAACPTCGEGIAQSDPQGQSLAAGMYYSILFMMSMPYVILATVGCVFYFHIRRARLAKAAEESAGSVESLPNPQRDSIIPA